MRGQRSLAGYLFSTTEYGVLPTSLRTFMNFHKTYIGHLDLRLSDRSTRAQIRAGSSQATSTNHTSLPDACMPRPACWMGSLLTSTDSLTRAIRSGRTRTDSLKFAGTEIIILLGLLLKKKKPLFIIFRKTHSMEYCIGC